MARDSVTHLLQESSPVNFRRHKGIANVASCRLEDAAPPGNRDSGYAT